ncbi:25044_t:CDS:2 [Dentiscutata erythropus]|uniref:25044_t:CDS:1 n=1 Tax=Dentiscutata erythropus TaxID=1348616 RepID=A0A9N8YTN8_9GLOM|nr:25044_t:CDS:2 [Dentiscutata erythropus]
MSRLIFLTLLLAFIGFTSAQVGQVNTPSDKIATGANVIITWMYTQQVNQIPGTLSCVDNSTKNTVLLSSTVDLSAQSYTWSVNVPAGTYYLALNDGSGDKYSGTFIPEQVNHQNKPQHQPACPVLLQASLNHPLLDTNICLALLWWQQ